METIAIIPARYGSNRLPGKPLADIAGEPMVWRVYSRVAEALGSENVYVATDHEAIISAVTSRGGNAVLTDSNISCGTARCEIALNLIDRTPDVVINVQGDEPFIKPEHIELLSNCFTDPDVEIATLARKFSPTEGFDALFSPNAPKVTFDANNFALYFSRSIIPYVRDIDWREWINSANFYMHIGTYAFRPDTLRQIVKIPECDIEKAEKLEQLRWLHSGLRIKVAVTETPMFSIDTPEDLKAAIALFNNAEK